MNEEAFVRHTKFVIKKSRKHFLWQKAVVKEPIRIRKGNPKVSFNVERGTSKFLERISEKFFAEVWSKRLMFLRVT